MKQDKRKREPKSGYDTTILDTTGERPDPSSPFYEAQLHTEEERKELLKDRAARYSEVNPPISSIGHISSHPREFQPYKIIERPEAMQLLGVGSAELSKLVRRGVVRKAHPAAWSGLVYDDVALLASTQPGTPARTDIEVRLRMQNIDNYLSAFSPDVYYDMDGKPKPVLDADKVDREGSFAYQEGLASLPTKFKSILRPVPYEQSKDHKLAHDVQFLYLADEDNPHMTTALLMRRWYRETHPQVRYNVARVAIPPVEELGRPEHRGVLKFLVEAAAILYQIDFEAVPHSYYGRMKNFESRLKGDAMGLDLNNLYLNLTGAQISTKDDLHALLSTQDSTAALPLRFQVAAWYQAYNNLMSEGKTPSFSIHRVKYIDALIQNMTDVRVADLDPLTVASLRKKVASLIGCSPGTAPYYRPERPPLYVGEPPSYWEESGNKRLHKKLLGSEMPYNVEILMRANSLADATESRLLAAKGLNSVLPWFHKSVADLMPPTTLVKQDKLVVSQLFALLKKHGVSPHTLYLYPYRDAEELVKGLKPKLDEVLTELRAWRGSVVERPPTGDLQEMPNPHKLPSILLTDITEDMRIEYAYEFSRTTLGFTDEDLTGMTPNDILESLPDTQSLDEYIVKAADDYPAEAVPVLEFEDLPDDVGVLDLDAE